VVRFFFIYSWISAFAGTLKTQCRVIPVNETMSKYLKIVTPAKAGTRI